MKERLNEQEQHSHMFDFPHIISVSMDNDGLWVWKQNIKHNVEGTFRHCEGWVAVPRRCGGIKALQQSSFIPWNNYYLHTIYGCMYCFEWKTGGQDTYGFEGSIMWGLFPTEEVTKNLKWLQFYIRFNVYLKKK